MAGDTPAQPLNNYGELWVEDSRRWNDSWRAVLNSHRASLGLSPVDNVRSHVLTARPWLAADSTLAETKKKLRDQMESMLRAEQDPRVVGDPAIFDTYKYVGSREKSYDFKMKAIAEGKDPATVGKKKKKEK